MYLKEEKIRLAIRKALLSEKYDDDFVGYKGSGGGDDDSDQPGEMGGLENIEFVGIPNPSAVTAAKSENAFWSNGKRKEDKNDKETNSRLKSYWSSAGNKPRGRLWSWPWSAAFISYVMQKTKEGRNFKSVAHTSWATKALKNRKKLISNPEKFKVGDELYVLFGRDEVKAEPGDVPFRLRGGNIDSWISSGGGQAKSHSDIYIGGGKVIGGNLSNSSTIGDYDHPTIIKKIKITGIKDKDKLT